MRACGLSCGSMCECVGTPVNERAGMTRIFFFCLYSFCVIAGMPQFALVVAVILKCSTSLAIISE